MDGTAGRSTSRRAVATARARRSDIVRQAAADRGAQRHLDLRYANNQLKPRLDLEASYDLSALAGDLVQVDPKTGEVTAGISEGYARCSPS